MTDFFPETLFLDRDGVVNVRIVDGYVTRVEDFVFLPGVLEAMRLLRPRFKRIIIVSNQQGIGKGLFTMEQLHKVHSHMQAELGTQGTPVDGIYVCPHLANEHCSCRKPNIGLALQAKKDFPEIDLNSSIMVGDSVSDMHFALNANMIPVSVGPDDAQRDMLASEHYHDLLDFAAMVNELFTES